MLIINYAHLLDCKGISFSVLLRKEQLKQAKYQYGCVEI